MAVQQQLKIEDRVVTLKDLRLYNRACFTELADTLGDPADAYKKKIKKDLAHRLNRLTPTLSPSELVHSPDKAAELLGDETPIHLGRPGSVPAAIFLQRRLEYLEEVQVSRQDVDRAAKYVQCSTAFHKDEKAIKELVNGAIGTDGVWRLALNWADNIKPDGCWWYHDFLVLVLELKNTVGLSGDALLQAVIDYSKIVAHEKFKSFREYSNFPVVLVGATANRLEISIAVCIGSIYVTKLLALDLTLGFHASDNVIRVARVFKALSCCRVDLQSYYDEVRSLAFLRLSCLYPSPLPADPLVQMPQVVYQQFLSRTGQPTSALVDLGRTTTAMYIATLDNSQEVVVKFTARYNKMAHDILANAQLAPKLHFCEHVIGGVYMVVMDRVDGKSLWQLQEDKSTVPAVVAKKVEDALRLLHDCDIVFGDLRDSNILYLGEDRVVLVDFDWPAKDGEGRYPAMLNPKNTWSDDVVAYGIMRKSHDLWQLDRLKALCVANA